LVIQLFNTPIVIDAMSIIEILLLYIAVFFIIRFLFFSKTSLPMRLSAGVFILIVLVLEYLSYTIHEQVILIVKYRYIVYVSVILIYILVFQPELRHIVIKTFGFRKTNSNEPLEIVEILKELKQRNCGAFLVVENSISVQPFITSYIEIDSKLSKELIISIFSKSSILHDGAVVIERDKIKYAKVFFKFVDNEVNDVNIGARHRAAIYISEQTDCDAYVVSEERGTISYYKHGKLENLL
jgi:diadenylate cyclase